MPQIRVLCLSLAKVIQCICIYFKIITNSFVVYFVIHQVFTVNICYAIKVTFGHIINMGHTNFSDCPHNSQFLFVGSFGGTFPSSLLCHKQLGEKVACPCVARNH